jgi:hypothetical protein
VVGYILPLLLLPLLLLLLLLLCAAPVSGDLQVLHAAPVHALQAKRGLVLCSRPAAGDSKAGCGCVSGGALQSSHELVHAI